MNQLQRISYEKSDQVIRWKIVFDKSVTKNELKIIRYKELVAKNEYKVWMRYEEFIMKNHFSGFGYIEIVMKYDLNKINHEKLARKNEL